MAVIRLPPQGWKPRKYQGGLWLALQRGMKRAIAIAHRRWGKDEIALHWSAHALTKRVGAWWHCLPEYAQARKAIWNQVNPHTGRKRIDEAFPPEIRKRTNDHEMYIELVNGSTWQVIGSDNYNHLVGASPLGITFSEWALAKPAAWAYFSPILDENDGTAIFITTPRGKNHAYKTLQAALADPEKWFASVQGVLETGYPLERVEAQRNEYRTVFGDDAGDALIDQEYFVSFEAAILGSIYGKEISILRNRKRIRPFPIDPTLPVHRCWDFGYSDAMAIWFFQWVGHEVRWVDYLEGSLQAIRWYANRIHAKQYPRGTKDNPACDFVPQDAKVHELLAEGKTRVEGMIEYGLNPVLVPPHYVLDRHAAARKVLRQSWFHPRCADALETLGAYQYEFDDKAMVFRKEAKHNYASHNADSFGIGCVAHRTPGIDKIGQAPGRALHIDVPLIGVKDGRPQVTIDDIWKEHERQMAAERKRMRLI